MNRLALIGLLSLVACSRESAPPAVVAKKAVVEEAAPAVIARTPAVTSAAELNAKVDWDVGADRFTASILDKDSGGRVVAITANGATHELEVTFGDSQLLSVHRGALLYRSREILDYGKRGRTAADALGAMLIEWDAATKKPTVAESWSCDEIETKHACKPPAWLDGAPPA
jgi:hypothetical protein